METPKIDVAYIAELAKLELSEDERARYTVDLEQILAYVAQLERWDTQDVPPSYHPLEMFDALRADIIGTGLSNEDALANAPQKTDGQFRVPKVVESAH